MIDDLLHALATSNLPLTDEELADVLWLASYMDMPSNAPSLASAPEVKPQPSTPVDAPNRHQQSIKDNQAVSPSSPSTTSARAEVHLPKPSTHEKQSVDGMRALSFHSPAATALPGKLALARALRPFLRKIPSFAQLELDEVATAEQAAEEGRIAPQLRPGRERWLDVAVVIDDWHTMAIWQQTIAEFIELLQQLGAFRTLQMYLLSTKGDGGTEQGTLQLFMAQGFKRGRICRPGELFNPWGRRLMLVLTDCTSPIWSSGAAGQLLSQWGNRNIVTLVQMLPADLWNSCALVDAIQVAVSAPAPGIRNAKLTVERPWYWDDIWDEDRTPAMLSQPVPVVTLEPEALRRWTQVLAGKGGSKATAFYLPRQPTPLSNQKTQTLPESLSPEERWLRFRANASPMAQELAGYLSAAPLSLPVMRLVQRVMLSKSRQVHLAEVLRSDLVYFAAEHAGLFKPDVICYEFVREVRKLLLTSILLSDTKKVLEKTSEYIGRYSDQLRQFHALVLDPTSAGEFRIDNDDLPFARVATIVLRRLGGKYTKLAKYLEDNLELVSTIPSLSTESNLSIPPFFMSEPGRSSKPVVFLAFADSVEANLPRLTDELRQVRAALAPAVKNGWCNVIVRANVTLDDILAVFREQRDQIVLFHYAGNATSYQLLLNVSAGKLNEVNAGGLAEFLSQQRNLQLVVLNGCSTGGQVDALLDAGVGAVIATAQDILDDAALEIAQAFYTSFSSGQPLQNAYNEAVATMRALYGEDVASSTPWQLRIRPERNQLRYWILTSPLPEVTRALPSVDCPYRGLEYFDVPHAANYFGREAMTAKLLAKVQECNFIAVVGPSGCGKSSLVRAGLMVALADGAIADSRDWRLEIFRPGENPLQALTGTLLRLNPLLSNVDRWTEIEKLAKRLGYGELSIGLVLEQIRGPLTRLVLIIDQFEETFTLCTDEKLRVSFLDTLLAAAAKPWLTVIFTLRADFYGRVLEHESFSKRVDSGLVNVLPMTHEERRLAIEQPALQVKRSFESGLVERILDAVEDEPGQLPLLEFTLTELWQRQTSQGTMTHAAYEDIGEVSGAIAKRADEMLRHLPVADQQRMRTIFTRLVRVAPPNEGSEDTKRRLLLNEIDPTLRPLVQSLADARLVVTGRDEQQKSDTVEVAHEALIRNWSVLQSWLNSDREFLLWHQRLRTLIENWQATYKDEGSLLRGATLQEAQSWLATRFSELSSLEQQFIKASVASSMTSQQEIDMLRRRVTELENQNKTVLNSAADNKSTTGFNFRSLWKRLRGES